VTQTGVCWGPLVWAHKASFKMNALIIFLVTYSFPYFNRDSINRCPKQKKQEEKAVIPTSPDENF
jgi:hypothetical protein